MEKQLFNQRWWSYVGNNFGFSLHYDKVFKKEYLPSRIRYNQFFFFAGLTTGFMYLLSNRSQAPTSTDLSQRKYYSGDRTVVNMFQRAMNSSSAKNHANRQHFTF